MVPGPSGVRYATVRRSKEVPTEKAKKVPEEFRNDYTQLEKMGVGFLKNVLPKAYSDPRTTSFEVVVPEEGKTDIILNLDSKADEKGRPAREIFRSNKTGAKDKTTRKER
jgi:hypothetical protein